MNLVSVGGAALGTSAMHMRIGNDRT
jgi:hypothetical protein